MADAATSEPFNFELFDLSAGAFVTLSVTEAENKPGRGVVYSGVPPGTYAVLFFKAGCFGGLPMTIIEPPFGFLITEPAALVVNLDDVDPDCIVAAGSGNGQADISVSGGTSPYTIVWAGPTPVPPGTLSTASNLDAGNYTVTITDANGCPEVLNVVIPVTTQANAGPLTGLACGANSFVLSGNAFAAGEIGTWTGPPGVTFSPNANTPTATANNLAVGANILTWTITDDAFVCIGSSDNITVTHSNVNMTGSADVVLLCFGATTASGTFTVTGGVAPYTYTVVSNTAGATVVLPAPGPTTSVNFTNGGAGVVTLQVQDNTGCTDQVTITITQPASPVTITRSPGATLLLACNGDTNGAGSFTASGGTGAHTFTVTTNTTGGTTSISGSVLSFSGAGAGTISVDVRDANNCLQTSTITVTAPPALVLTPSSPTVTLLCNGGTNGSGSFTASGGTGAYTFTIIGNTTGATTSIVGSVFSFTGASAGTISIGVLDANSCSQTSAITVLDPPALVLTPSAPTITLLCNGDTNGSGSFTASGGTGAHTFTVTTNTTGGTTSIVGSVLSFSGAGPGTISVDVRDVNNCLQTSSITVAAPPLLVLTPSAPTITLLCNGDANGSGSFTASGGTGAHTFTVTTNTTGGTTSIAGSVLSFTGAGAGTISVDVRDVNNCLQTSSITITAPTALVLTPSAPTISLLCNGDTNGSGSFTASGGTGAHTFTVTTNTTGGTTSIVGSVLSFSGAGPGTISVDVRDVNNCLQTSLITITAPPALVLTPSAPTITLLCSSDTNGSGNFTASGGTGAHTFTVTTNTTGGTTSIVGSVLSFSGAGPGTISVDVRDANNCLQTSSITVTAPPALVVTPSSPTITLLCNGDTNGSGSFTASGGTGVHIFTVSVNTTGATTAIVGSVLSFTGAGPGIISVGVLDANNCPQTSSITITAPPALVLTPSAPTITLLCSGDTNGSGNFTVSGGTGPYAFAVTGNTTGGATVSAATTLTFTGAGAGTISVEVRDANNCLQTSSITISTPPALVLTPSSPTIALLCNGDTNGSGGFTASGGTGAHTLTITVNTTGATTSITGSVLSFSGAGPGTITVEVRDANNCLQTSSITITAPPVLTLSNPGDVALTCTGGNNATGTFTAGGGTAPYIFTVLQNTTGATTSSTATSITYANGGGGVIEIQVEDAGGCTQTQLVTVTASVVITVTASSTDADCLGVDNGSITITGTTGGNGSYEYSLDGGSFSASLTYPNLAAGDHTVTARDGLGCLSSPLTVTIGATSIITFTSSSTATTVCAGSDGSITVTGSTGGSGTYNYLINGVTVGTAQPDNFIFTNLAAGIYQVVVEDNATSCMSVMQLVTVDSPVGCVLNCFAFTVEVDPQTQRPACNGGQDGVIALKVTASTPIVLVTVYKAGDPVPAPIPNVSGFVFVFSDLEEGIYEYRIEDPLGNVCVQSFVWDAVQDIQASVTDPEDSKCFGIPSGSVVIDATGSATGQYFFSVDGTTWTEFLPGNRVTGLPAGSVNIRIGGTVDDACYDEVTVTINQLGTAALDTLYVSPVSGFPAVSYPESPTATRVIGIDGSGAPDYEIQLRLIDSYGIELNPPFITSWTLVDETTTLGIPQKQMNDLYAGVYELAVRDAVGCERTFNFTIELDDRIFIPNIFTPNASDDLNSTFFVRNLPESGSKLSVTDRWGKQVYSSNNYSPTTLWDGGDTPDGVYFYSLHIKDGKTYTGWIEILRGTKP
jgi:gliding motility-associated-like protein